MYVCELRECSSRGRLLDRKPLALRQLSIQRLRYLRAAARAPRQGGSERRPRRSPTRRAAPARQHTTKGSPKDNT